MDSGATGSLSEQLAQAFIATGSFKFEAKGFRLASGLLSPYYVDCRTVMAHPGPRELVARLALQSLDGLRIDCVGGLEIGAIAMATALSDYAYLSTPRRAWRTFVVRKQSKDHGLGKLIDGAIQPSDHALIVDDVLTSGASLVKAVRASREAGLQVDYTLVIVDRKEQEGRATVEEHGVRVMSLLSLNQLQEARGET
jgi:orotate phosphoribosyltransferase